MATTAADRSIKFQIYFIPIDLSMQFILIPIHVYKKWDFDKANISNSIIHKPPKLYFDLEYINRQMAIVDELNSA